MARERLLTTSAKKKEQGRPSAAHLWLRRSRRFVGPALFGSAILMGFGLIAYGIAAVDPASQARRMLDTVAVFGSDRSMTVQAVIVDGRQNTPLPLIREALGVSRGDSMLEFSPEAAKQRLESIPWVARAHVERHLPGTIVLRLEERRPFAIWQNQGRFVIVDREGKTVATDGLDQFGPLPLIVGPGADRAAAQLYDLLAAETA
ncbi:MAG: cell division protein FtsQ/DivIB, partial [Alphaproteobacteria bacterium]